MCHCPGQHSFRIAMEFRSISSSSVAVHTTIEWLQLSSPLDIVDWKYLWCVVVCRWDGIAAFVCLTFVGHGPWSERAVAQCMGRHPMAPCSTWALTLFCSKDTCHWTCTDDISLHDCVDLVISKLTVSSLTLAVSPSTRMSSIIFANTRTLLPMPRPCQLLSPTRSSPASRSSWERMERMKVCVFVCTFSCVVCMYVYLYTCVFDTEKALVVSVTGIIECC